MLASVQGQVHRSRNMNDIRSVDFSDAQIKSFLFEVYSAGFEAGYSHQVDVCAGFRSWYRDVIQKDNLPVYAALDSADKDVRDAIDSVCCIKTILHSGHYEPIRPQLEFAAKVLEAFIVDRR